MRSILLLIVIQVTISSAAFAYSQIPDFYEFLNIPMDSSEYFIEKALAIKKITSADDKATLQWAKDILLSPARRQLYDLRLVNLTCEKLLGGASKQAN